MAHAQHDQTQRGSLNLRHCLQIRRNEEAPVFGPATMVRFFFKLDAHVAGIRQQFNVGIVRS
eukprot:m.112441 g.112441  ORF g.112441 m.112441 type:complete len:62 (-) comp12965_c0_seq11:1257-1442(-)